VKRNVKRKEDTCRRERAVGTFGSVKTERDSCDEKKGSHIKENEKKSW